MFAILDYISDAPFIIKLSIVIGVYVVFLKIIENKSKKENDGISKRSNL